LREQREARVLATTNSTGGRRKWCARTVTALCVVVVVSLVGQRAEATEQSQLSFLHSHEIRSADTRVFAKWRAALKRYSEERVRERARKCKATLFKACYYKDWQNFLNEIRRDDKWDQLVAVNRYMNRRHYVSDSRNWGVKDYWATPGEFMARSGDCEDFAIAKYLSLRQLGWSEDTLRVAVVRDLSLNVNHAVLIVYFDGRTWLLDNQIRRVVETETVRHYRPVFSINEKYWWRHRV
jgi:predicted transglutaminase-like cysteine proteinase